MRRYSLRTFEESVVLWVDSPGSDRAGPLLWPVMSALLRPAALLATYALGALALAMLLVGCGGSGGGSNGSDVRAEPVSGQRALPTTTRPPARSTSAATPRTTGSTPPAGDGPAVSDRVRIGAEVLVEEGFPPLLGRRVGLIANRASVVGGQPLIDVLADHPDIELVALFAPEHGLGADDEAGETVADGLDPDTGLTVHSLYGDERAPTVDVLAELDVLVFDLQDAGARFYTYTSTLGLAMQAAAEADVPVVVLDRPNPLGGDRPDGQLLDPGHASFIGLYPIPMLHGLTAGELALAIRGEGWLTGLDGLDLEVIGLDGWDRSARWDDTGLDWVAPSPGLPSPELALLYPTTVLLEATTVSFGRGTDRPFGQFGAPWLDAEALVAELDAIGLAGVGFETTTFVPDGEPTPVPAVRLTVVDRETIRPLLVGVHVLDRLIAQAGDRTIVDRPDFLDLLAGGPALRQDLAAGRDPADIAAGWADDLDGWERTRAPYLLYGPAGS